MKVAELKDELEARGEGLELITSGVFTSYMSQQDTCTIDQDRTEQLGRRFGVLEFRSALHYGLQGTTGGRGGRCGLSLTSQLECLFLYLRQCMVWPAPLCLDGPDLVWSSQVKSLRKQQTCKQT